jgi:acyl dehydratase
MTEQVYFEDVEEGEAIPSLTKWCSTQQLVMWAAASGDFYQIHYDIDFAKSTGLENLIVHGALKHAFLGQLVHEWVSPGGFVQEYGCQYRGMDFPGEEMLVRGVVTKKYEEGERRYIELDVWTENAAGDRTTPGTARVVLPSHG